MLERRAHGSYGNTGAQRSRPPMKSSRLGAFSGCTALTLALTIGACGGDAEEVSIPLGEPASSATPGPVAKTTAPVMATVGNQGGSVLNAEGVGVTVPPGALPEDVTLTVTSTPDALPPPKADAVGTPTTFGPSGLQFAKPVTVVLTFDPAKLPPGIDASRIVVFTAPDGTTNFEPLPTTVVDATHVSAQTIHFSVLVPVIPPPGVCFPTSCASLAPACGEQDDKCGGKLDCGPCFTDGGAADAGADGDAGVVDGSMDACVALTCGSYGPGTCGPRSDGCGVSIDCGACPVDAGDLDASADADGDAADADADADVDADADACTPMVCGSQCGMIANGCGGILNCGACPVDAGTQ